MKLFQRREKQSAPPVPYLIIRNNRGETLYDGRLDAYSPSDKTVVALSIEFFNDPEPCVIHRSAVLKRVYMELQEFLSPVQGEYPLEQLPPRAAQLLDGMSEASSAQIEMRI